MRTRALAGGLFLGIGLFFLAGRSGAVITSLLSLEKLLNDSTCILNVRVESLEPEKRTMVLTVDRQLKGKLSLTRMVVQLRGDDEAVKAKQPSQLLKRLQPKLPLTLFIRQRDNEFAAFAYTNGSWFQLFGVKPEDSDTIRWRFAHLEPYLRRTFKGSTEKLQTLLADVLAGKSKPPQPNAMEKPGLGPEIATPSDDKRNECRLRIVTGPLFGVIALPTLAGPLAVLALLFPSLFGGWKRWLAVLSAICTASTIYFAFWLLSGQLAGTVWGADLVQWLMQTTAFFLACLWAWQRQLRSEPASCRPSRSELVLLIGFGLLGLSVLFCGFCFGANLLSQAWLLVIVICAGAWTAAAHVALALSRSGERAALSREVVMLSAMTLAAIGLATATGQPRPVLMGGPTETAENTLDAWGVTEGKHLWTHEVKQPGVVCSAPLIAGERTYVALAYDDGFFKDGAVCCLNTRSGALIWTSYRKIKMQMISISTPCLAQGKLYIGEGFHENSHCKLYCLDAETGAQAWSFQTNSHVESSPTVVDGRVYFGAGDDGVYCVNAQTGKEIWHVPGLHIDSKPLVDDGRVYVGGGVGDLVQEAAIVCLDAVKGQRIWHQTVPLPAWGSPVRAGNLIYFGLGNGRLNMSDSNPQGAVIAVRADTGEEVWRFWAGDAVLNRPAVDYARVYFGSRDGFVYCVDRLTGRLFWKRQVGSPVVTELTLATDDKTVATNSVYALAERGNLLCLGPLTGQILWSNDLSQVARGEMQLWSSPALSVTGNDKGQVRRLIFGVTLGRSNGTVPIVCCFEDRVDRSGSVSE